MMASSVSLNELDVVCVEETIDAAATRCFISSSIRFIKLSPLIFLTKVMNSSREIQVVVVQLEISWLCLSFDLQFRVGIMGLAKAKVDAVGIGSKRKRLAIDDGSSPPEDCPLELFV